MKQYDSYKISNVEWIGDIPENWNVKKIKWLSPVKRGASPRPIDDPKYFDDNGEYSWVRISDVSSSERYLEKTIQVLSELGASLSVKREPGDFFLSIAGSVGKPIITKIKCCIHDGFVWFPQLKLNTEYLYYIFETGMPYKGLGKLGTQLNLNTDTVADIGIPFPTRYEIDNIVRFLDRKTFQISKIIDKKEKLLILLEEEQKAIINQAVTKGINLNIKFKESGVEWLGEIPEHWIFKKLKYTVCVNREALGEGTNKGYEIKYIDISSVDYAGNICNIENFAFADAPSRARRIIRKGDTIVSTVRTYLKSIAFINLDDNNLICSTGFAVLSSKGALHQKYLYYQARSDSFVSQITFFSKGVSYPAINSEDINNIFILIPPIEEQNLIISHIERQTKKINSTKSKIQKEIDLLKEYKQSIIFEAVTGKIDVRETKYD